MDKPSNWEEYLYVTKFTYDNGYHGSLKTSSFEAIYGRKYSTLLSWDNLVGIMVIGEELLKDMGEKMEKIKKNLKINKIDKQNYVDRGRNFK